jgi:hypothetical protein
LLSFLAFSYGQDGACGEIADALTGLTPVLDARSMADGVDRLVGVIGGNHRPGTALIRRSRDEAARDKVRKTLGACRMG